MRSPPAAAPSPLGPPVGRSWQFLEIFLYKQVRTCIKHAVLYFFSCKDGGTIYVELRAQVHFYVWIHPCVPHRWSSRASSTPEIDLLPLQGHSTTTQGLLFTSVLIGYFFLHLNII